MNRILHSKAAEDALGLEKNNLMWNPTSGVNEGRTESGGEGDSYSNGRPVVFAWHSKD